LAVDLRSGAPRDSIRIEIAGDARADAFVTTTPSRSSASRALPTRPLASREDLEEFHRQLFLPLVWRATWKHGLSKEDAKDLVQEAFLLALVKLKVGDPRGWFIQVVDYLSTNYRRKTFRRAQLAARWGTGSRGQDGSQDLEVDDDA
jgi:DNA-directed RNA polymerase specialized sigma24 family protein